MGLLALSLIVASVVYVIVRPPSWLSPALFPWRDPPEAAVTGAGGPRGQGQGQGPGRKPPGHADSHVPRPRHDPTTAGNASVPSDPSTPPRDRAAMPTSPPPPTVQPPAIDRPNSPTTPRASASRPSQHAVPRLCLSDEAPALASAPESAPSLMPPPPPPPLSAARIPMLPLFPAPNSAQRARGPVPNRRPPPSLSPPGTGLAPPPTHFSRPQKPSRKVTLEPGHSPLDWARISGPSTDLRGVPPSTPYLRVPPSMLKKQTGRRGKDAWMALSGKVYNVTPYAKFHPGGVPELMRGAGRDGTKLFGEIHPWVNYETMLAACLVGLLVDEPEGDRTGSEMDQMD